MPAVCQGHRFLLRFLQGKLSQAYEVKLQISDLKVLQSLFQVQVHTWIVD